MRQREKERRWYGVENEAEIDRAQVGLLIRRVGVPPESVLSLLANKEKVDENKAKVSSRPEV